MLARIFLVNGDNVLLSSQPVSQSLGGGNLPIRSIQTAFNSVKRQCKLIYDFTFPRVWVGSKDNRPDKIAIIKILNRLIQETNVSFSHLSHLKFLVLKSPASIADCNFTQRQVEGKPHVTKFTNFSVLSGGG